MAGGARGCRLPGFPPRRPLPPAPFPPRTGLSLAEVTARCFLPLASLTPSPSRGAAGVLRLLVHRSVSHVRDLPVRDLPVRRPQALGPFFCRVLALPPFSAFPTSREWCSCRSILSDGGAGLRGAGSRSCCPPWVAQGTRGPGRLRGLGQETSEQFLGVICASWSRGKSRVWP